MHWGVKPWNKNNFSHYGPEQKPFKLIKHSERGRVIEKVKM